MSESSHLYEAADSIKDVTSVDENGDTTKSTVFTFTPSGGSEVTITSTSTGIGETAEKIKENDYLNTAGYTVTIRYDGTTLKGLDYASTKT